MTSRILASGGRLHHGSLCRFICLRLPAPAAAAASSRAEVIAPQPISVPYLLPPFMASSLHTTAIRAGVRATFNERKNVLTNYNRAKNAKRRLDVKWDSEKQDRSFKEDMPIGYERRKLKKLKKVSTRLANEANRDAKLKGTPKGTPGEPFHPERNFRLRVRELSFELKARNDRIKTVSDPADATQLLEDSITLVRKEMKILRVLLRGRDPKFDDYDQAVINASRLRVPWISLIIMAMRIDNIQLAFNLFNDMKKQGIHPNATCFHALLSGLVHHERRRAPKRSDTQPFRTETKSFQMAEKIFGELQELWRLALPAYVRYKQGPRAKSKEAMMHAMRIDQGADTSRLRRLSHEAAVLEARDHRELLAQPLAAYLRILLMAGQTERAWKLFDQICYGQSMDRNVTMDAEAARDLPVLPLVDKKILTTMLSEVPDATNHGQLEQTREEADKRFEAVSTIWQRWKLRIERMQADIAASNAQGPRQPPQSVAPSSAEYQDDGSLDSADDLLASEDGSTDPRSAQGQMRFGARGRGRGGADGADDKKIRGTPATEWDLVVPEERAIVLLLNKVHRTRPKEQALIKDVMAFCFGIENNDHSGLIALDPTATDLVALRPDAVRPAKEPLVELNGPVVADQVLRAFNYQASWTTAVDYFNHLQRRDGDRTGPLGPLLSSRGVAATLVALGFSIDPVGTVVVLKASRQPPDFLPTDQTYARSLRSIAHGVVEGREALGGLTAQMLESEGRGAVDLWQLAEDTFKMFAADWGPRQGSSKEESASSRQAGAVMDADATSKGFDVALLYRLLLVANRASRASTHQAARSRRCLDLVETYRTLPQLVSAHVPPRQREADSKRTEKTDIATVKMLEELHVTLSNAIMPHYDEGEEPPSKAKVERWKETREAVASFRPQKEKRYEEKRWLQGGVTRGGGGGGSGSGNGGAGDREGIAKRGEGGETSKSRTGGGAGGGGGVVLKLSDDDYAALSSEDDVDFDFEIDEPSSGGGGGGGAGASAGIGPDAATAGDEAGQRRKTRRGMAMDRELERWIRG
ncbi:uncharacterized protein PFL1_05246 [Pseudozyma flocculosa PF-1]|uniref:Uncharacterized protein n=1 Tax=Pseudozyma flocculosa PF-1 TaxID=1277687 RepID=A0A061H4H1_9BASI|nr:uncharacterized protein PFL1_05246 [Pseudozyma flocculosa PF-1]EPQ27324.1 hypothetical protein PFL1_05246 [Pseudozyma flocculosa PF-1]